MRASSIALSVLSLIIAAQAAPVKSGDEYVVFASVNNHCDFDVYAQLVTGYDGKPTGKTVDSGTISRNNGNLIETYYQTWHDIQVDGVGLDFKPLGLNYKLNETVLSYSLSDRYGNNAFSGFRNTLTYGGKGECFEFDCAPNDKSCYSGKKHEIIGQCELPDGQNGFLTLDLCA